jgi:hypothetical protein
MQRKLMADSTALLLSVLELSRSATGPRYQHHHSKLMMLQPSLTLYRRYAIVIVEWYLDELFVKLRDHNMATF